jgi:hypothetical protein
VVLENKINSPDGQGCVSGGGGVDLRGVDEECVEVGGDAKLPDHCKSHH